MSAPVTTVEESSAQDIPSAPKFIGPYPAVNYYPTVGDCLSAMRFSDYMQWTGATIGSWTYGFLVGKPARFHMAGLMAGVGFTFGSCLILQNTRGRLMGLRENKREIQLYGAAPKPSVMDVKLHWNSVN